MLPTRQSSGSALIEAVVIAPGLALVLGAVVALHAMYSAKLSAKEHARRLAWLQADSGDCPPSSCSSPSCRTTEREIERDLAPTGIASGGMSLDSFLRDIGEFFMGRVTRGVTTANAKLPGMMRSGETTQQGAFELLCNTRARATSSGDSVLEHACRAGLRNAEYAREVCR